MNDLIDKLNSLESYPTLSDLHDLAATLQQCSQDEINALLASLANPLLVDDIRRLVSGALPSTMTAPIFVQPVAPQDPSYAEIVRTIDPGFQTEAPPEIKPPGA